MKTHATRIQDLQSYEQWMGADLLELCVGDYSLKVVRTILAYEAQYMHDALLCTVAPLQYGVMPNLGLYSKPDGPCDNWNELLPLGRIPEARAPPRKRPSRWPSSTWSISPTRSRRPAPTRSTGTPPAPPATRSSSPP